MPTFSNFELPEFNYIVRLPENDSKGLEKLREARVLVIGAGETGCTVIKYLAEAGVGTIAIADYARIGKPENLTPVENAGKFKTVALAEDIKINHTDCLVNCHNIKITRLNVVDLVSSYDVIVDCSGDSRTHFLVSDVTELLDIPMVCGAKNNIFGLAAVFNFDGGPSYRCLPEEELKWIENASRTDSETTQFFSEILGLIQASEVIRLTTSTGEVLKNHYLKLDILTHSAQQIFFTFPQGYNASGIRSDYGEEHEYTLPVITPVELMREMDAGLKLTVFDIRSPEQFIDFNIGGINVSADFLLNNPEDIPIEGKVVIVCKLGDESMAIVDYLRNNENLSNVFNLEGGIQNWLENNL